VTVAQQPQLQAPVAVKDVMYSAPLDPSEAPSTMEAAARAQAAAEGLEVPPEAVEDVPMQPVVKSDWDKTPRNAPCPCGSGKKFKLCHGQ
jgi:preprotein translocase subunit SecA